jgi:hypothetical protein
MKRRAWLVLTAVVSLVLLQGRVTGAEKPVRLVPEVKDIESSLGTDWYGVYLQGKKVGFFKSTRARTGKDADALYVESIQLHMKLQSFGQKTQTEIRQITRFDTKPPYAMVSAEATEISGANKQHYVLKRSDKGFVLTYTTGQEKRTKQVPPIDYTLADSMTDELWVQRGAKPGERIISRSFDVKDLDLDLTTSKLLAAKTSQVNGVPVTYYEVETVSKKEQLVGLSRLDQKGRLLSGTIAGMIELRMESEAQAKNTEYSADLFVLGMVKIDKGLGQPRNVSGLAVEVIGKEAAALPAGPRQSLATSKAGTTVLKLGQRHGTPAKATDKEVQDALAETTTYPITDPKVKALAERAVGDANTPRDKVERLVHFVHRFIQPKLTPNAPVLYDLLERKQGDCKSYALLFTTLARAAGIPTREVGGLVYMGDDQKAFGGHAWNEVVLDGVWVPVDASCGEVEVNATHISFGNDTQATKTMATTLGKLSLKLLEVQHGK